MKSSVSLLEGVALGEVAVVGGSALVGSESSDGVSPGFSEGGELSRTGVVGSGWVGGSASVPEGVS